MTAGMNYRHITYLRIMLTLALTHLCLASHKEASDQGQEPTQMVEIAESTRLSCGCAVGGGE